jgi:hypothetical protein
MLGAPSRLRSALRLAVPFPDPLYTCASIKQRTCRHAPKFGFARLRSTPQSNRTRCLRLSTAYFNHLRSCYALTGLTKCPYSAPREGSGAPSDCMYRKEASSSIMGEFSFPTLSKSQQILWYIAQSPFPMQWHCIYGQPRELRCGPGRLSDKVRSLYLQTLLAMTA